MGGVRIDRLVTLYLSGRLRRNLNGSEIRRVSILMYHGICEKQENTIHPYYQTNTLPKVFKSHIDFLSANGYEVIGLRDIDSCLKDPVASPKKYVVITFDDAYRNVYENAFPVLKEHDYTATIYMPTDFIDESRRDFQDKSCMNWEEAETLRGAGFSFGSHTASHRRLINRVEGNRIRTETFQRTDRKTTWRRG